GPLHGGRPGQRHRRGGLQPLYPARRQERHPDGHPRDRRPRLGRGGAGDGGPPAAAGAGRLPPAPARAGRRRHQRPQLRLPRRRPRRPQDRHRAERGGGVIETLLIACLAIGVVGLGFAGYLASYVRRQDAGSSRMQDISQAIQEGAMAFLGREYRTLVVFAIAVAIVLTAFISWRTALAFLAGAGCSALTGYIGMWIALKANVRTTAAAIIGINPGLRVAFSSGAVMGNAVVCIGVIGIIVVYLIFRDPNVVAGFSMGASSIALFARVGGGIYTKSADVGADLVGKVEAGIPEDDPRNPAVIADNVGDNVGDVAGMGADLFESYVGSIVAAIAIGATLPN